MITYDIITKKNCIFRNVAKWGPYLVIFSKYDPLVKYHFAMEKAIGLVGN